MARRSRAIWAVILVISQVAAACSVLGDSDVFADLEGSSSVPMVDPSGSGGSGFAGGEPGVSPYVCRDWTSLRTYSLKTELLDVSEVISMPFPMRNENGDWVSEPFGVSRVSDLVDELTSVEAFCDTGLSPDAVAAIEAYQAEPDLAIARQILYDAIDEEAAPFGMAVGESSAGEEPVTPRTASSDAMNMAGTAANRGDVEGSVALTELAVGLFEAESRKGMENNPSAQNLLDIAAAAQLLDLGKLSADAIKKLREQIKQELIDAWKDATKCAEMRSNQIEQMTQALARADVVGVPDELPSKGKKGFSLLTYHEWLNDWIQRQADAANGKRYEDCPGSIFRAERDWPIGSGGLEVYLSTCDYENWTGEMSAEVNIPVAEGTVIFELFFPLEFGPMEDRRGATAIADLDGRMVMNFKSPDGGSAKVTNVEAFKARAEFSINSPDDVNGGNIRIEFKPTVLAATVVADGENITMNFPISWGNVDLSGQFASGDGSCDNSNTG